MHGGLVAAAHDKLHARARLRVKWIRTNRDGRMLPLDPGEIGRNPSFARLRRDGARDDDAASDKAARHLFEHRAHDHRHARHYKHIPDLESGRDGHAVPDQGGAFWHPGHPLSHLVEFAWFVAGREQRKCFRIVFDRYPERAAHRVGRYIVVGGADAAGREHIGVSFPQGIERRDDLAFNIAHHAGFADVDPVGREKPGNVMEVNVLRAAGQNLVPDQEHSRGWRWIL